MERPTETTEEVETRTIVWAKGAPCFDKLRFVVRARSSDSGRPDLSRVNVERVGTETFILACDGRRLHLWKRAPQWVSGIYEVVTDNAGLVVLEPVTDQESYPNWRKAVPIGDPENTVGIELDRSRKNVTEYSREYARLCLAMDKLRPEGERMTYLDLGFFADLVGFDWTAELFGYEKAVVFESGDLTAVVMPKGEN